MWPQPLTGWSVNSADIYSATPDRTCCWPVVHVGFFSLSLTTNWYCPVFPLNTVALLLWGWEGGGCLWSQRDEEIRLDLMEELAKEATFSCYSMSRWTRGWLLYGPTQPNPISTTVFILHILLGQDMQTWPQHLQNSQKKEQVCYGNAVKNAPNYLN